MEERIPSSATEAALSNNKLKVPRSLPICIIALSLAAGLHHLLTNAFGNLHPYPGGLITLSFFIILTILLFPLGRKSWDSPLNGFFVIDLILILLIFLGAVYVLSDWEKLISTRVGIPTVLDQMVSSLYLVIVLEVSRRCVGWTITIISGFFLLTNLFSDYLWGWFYGPPVSWKTTTSIIFMVDEGGMFSIPIKICAEFVVTFLFFVGFLQVSGMDKKLVTLTTSLTGKYTGGPAKIAVVSSALVGTIQGTPAANVAATGSFTIPLMKRFKFEPAMAGAIEATASTGGQVMPPVMGMTAFLIATYLNVSYFEVCLRALIPTLIYYTFLYMGVHFYAKKRGLVGMPKQEIPSIRDGFGTGWPLLLPFGVLFALLAMGLGLSLVAVGGVATILVASSIHKDTRMSTSKLFSAFEAGAKLACTVVVACAAVGIIIGVFYVSGLGNRMAMEMEAAAGGNLFIGLGITALICIFLGMGITIPAVYILMLYITIPALINMGAMPFVAHFFVFMYAIVAAFTPPVGLALYVAAGIAEENLMKIGWRAMKLGLPLFLLPFFIAINPAILGFSSLWGVILVVVTSLLGAISLEAGFEGWFFRSANWIERILFIIGGILLFIPEIKTDLIGAAVAGSGILLQKIRKV